MTAQVPDYDALAAKFDRVASFIRPVADAIVAGCRSPPDGALVLDLGCGTGEPGLTVKKRHPAVRLLGIDQSEPMVEIARSKARRLGLSDTKFEVRLMSDTAVEPASVGLLVSRCLWLWTTKASTRRLPRQPEYYGRARPTRLRGGTGAR
uniref:class I SAM-dependent methyltransferase n=1 Tax=Paractinoplanes polyasparticus TaxID=2856853 RepID=UPI001C848079|nr:class I SAM-dependent methyltransferase [Actinoplanes polyasparticus]